MNGNTTDRLSQKDNCRKEKIGSILEDAAKVAGGVLSSIQALAGTTACKGVQIARLKEWAVNNNLWIDDISQLGTYSDRGSENENQSGKPCAVLTQPYILAEREASEDEITEELLRLGFHPEMEGEYFSNGYFDIFDASPNNYRSLSPNYSPKIH